MLSAFEESSAACISEMLRHVSGGQYIEGVRMAEKFVLHVETLFSAIDDLSAQFKLAGAKGSSLSFCFLSFPTVSEGRELSPKTTIT